MGPALVRPLQSQNAEFPISVTLPGILMRVKPVHPENALLPIFVTPSGRVMRVRPVQL